MALALHLARLGSVQVLAQPSVVSGWGVSPHLLAILSIHHSTCYYARPHGLPGRHVYVTHLSRFSGATTIPLVYAY